MATRNPRSACHTAASGTGGSGWRGCLRTGVDTPSVGVLSTARRGRAGGRKGGTGEGAQDGTRQHWDTGREQTLQLPPPGGGRCPHARKRVAVSISARSIGMADYVVSSIDFPRPEVVAAQADERALMRSEGWILPAP